MTRRKICVVSGSRADYGLLYWPMKQIQAEPELELQVAVTGMHLSPEFGLTVNEFSSDGFPVSAQVEMLLSGDSAVSVTKPIGLGVIGFADTLAQLRPDLLLVLGDRFEILAAVQAALIARVPVAHLCGGDVTEGAYDESIRHSITKISHLHFVTNAAAAAWVRQMGENPARIYNVGSPGLDHIKRTRYFGRQQLFESVGLTPCDRYLVITFHPVTLASTSTEQFGELLVALDRLGTNLGLIFTRPNADTEGRALSRMLDEFVADRANARVYVSLGRELYLNALKYAGVVVGNSSSGIYEAPSFKIPTVNIGDRQSGRLQAASVVNCAPERDAIQAALDKAMRMDCRDVHNPYGYGESAQRIVSAIRGMPEPANLLRKSFFEIESG